ncbi:MAG: hypothetical protein FHP94_13175 [Denitromonas halophila]|nr:MAG: hypothetical protein FHP94_13175 [Denitromonas halophila]TVT66560.1 MAG: hypothetical protein FHP93_18920 [Denitromonas halophila]
MAKQPSTPARWRFGAVLAVAVMLSTVAAQAAAPDTRTGGRVSMETFDTRYVLQSASRSNLALVPDPVHPARSAFRMVLKASDPKVFSGQRTEIVAAKEYVRTGLRWYAISFLLPSDWVSHPFPVLVAQIHTSQKAAALPPPLAAVVAGDRLRLELRNSSLPVEGAGAVTKASADTRLVSLGGLDPGAWHCLVVRADWSWEQGAGALDIWHNGELVYSVRNAPNAYQTWLGNYPKVGLYAPGSLGVAQRELYADFIWMGDDTATVQDMQALTPCAH